MRMTLREVTGGTEVRTLIGPSFRIWRFFRAALIVFACLGISGLVLGFLNWGNGGGTWGLYVLMLGLAGALFLYFLSEEAKRRTRDETGLLKAFLEGALDRELFPRRGKSPAMGVPRPTT